MAKKGSLNFLYLIGMAMVVVGSFLPIIRISFGFLGNIDFSIIDSFKNLGDLDSWLALIMFASAVAGLVLCFLGSGTKNLLTICLAVSFVVGMLFFYRGGFFEKWFKIVGFGFYVIVAGWIVALVGSLAKK